MYKGIILSLLVVACSVTFALAVPPGRTLDFDKSNLGNVVFSGTVHKDAGISCKECHNKDVFPKMKKGTVEITMKDIYAGKYCGVCHNGERAFAAKKSCKRCHVK